MSLAEEQRARSSSTVDDNSRTLTQLHLENVAVFLGPQAKLLRVDLSAKPWQATNEGETARAREIWDSCLVAHNLGANHIQGKGNGCENEGIKDS